MPSRPGFRAGTGFRTKSARRFIGTRKAAAPWAKGFFSETFNLVGQWGTHVDPPAHFVRGLRTVDQITLQEMVLPLVVIDVHAEAAKNPDYTLPLERVKKWETRPRPNSRGSVRGDANGLGEAVAG